MQATGGTALTGPEGPGRQPPRRVGVLLAVAAFVYLADVITKAVVVATLSNRPPIRLLGGLLRLRVLRNSGAAFSIGTSLTVVFTFIAVGVIFVILRMSRDLRSLPWAVALGLLLGGATGNLTDRLLRAPGVFRGDVVDWIQLPHWPVFNLADSAIVCGVALWALLLARGVPMTGQRQAAAQPGPDTHGERGTDAGMDTDGRALDGADAHGAQGSTGASSADPAGGRGSGRGVDGGPGDSGA